MAAFQGQRVVEILSALWARDRNVEEILDVVRRATRGRSRIPPEGVYLQLRRLEGAGLAESFWRVDDPRGPQRPKLRFKLLPPGRAFLKSIDAIKAME